ncbi:MAG: DUF4159 domain-containing protein [Planctomycetes bacterium]|nr:DUF4159 domain-containing protein [Planctomycetota bacterium]
MKHLRRALLVAIFAGWFHCAPYAKAVDDEAVNAAIKEGVSALLGHLRNDDEITYSRGGGSVTVRGNVTKFTRDAVQITTTEKKNLSITRSTISTWKRAGLVRDELDAPCAQGRSTLVALALAAAGVETTHPTFERLLAILEEGPGSGGGTYVYSLRASLWSTLLDRPLAAAHRNRLKKLLKSDVDWLQRAGRESGWYTYVSGGGGGDHSNTQFANLGLWSGSIGGSEVGNGHWQRISRHWLELQNPDGGWSYAAGTNQSTPSMTVAGCNSLYIALDRLYARPEMGYRVFEGIAIDKPARERISKIHAAIGRGNTYLEEHPPDGTNNSGYELFGLERLGLASGLAYIGGRDWFRAYAADVCRHDWGTDILADAFGVIFLVHGQAPVLFQKLEHGERFDDWSYYQRDLANLTRFVNRTFERLHRWQRIPVNATIRDMQDAPILYIAGQGPLELPNETMKRIRQYVEEGGTVFLHADRASRKFRDSAEKQFETLFMDYGWRFTDVPSDHAIYRCQFGGATSPWKRSAPLRAIQDGARLPIILCPVDLAGAWQQERGGFEEMFRIMANVRVYCASPYSELPRRLRRTSITSPTLPKAGILRLARPDLGGASQAHPAVWTRFNEHLRRRCGVALELVPKEDWKKADVVHLGMSTSEEFTEGVLTSLREYVRAGGMVFIDAVDGQPAAIDAANEVFEKLAVGEAMLLPSNHPIVSGTSPLARGLELMETTEAGSGLRSGGTTPPILVQTDAGGGCVLACPFDVTGGLDGSFVWKRVGYRPASTRHLMENVLLWRKGSRESRAGR